MLIRILSEDTLLFELVGNNLAYFFQVYVKTLREIALKAIAIFAESRHQYYSLSRLRVTIHLLSFLKLKHFI
jgi:hypothetical protein